MLSIPSVVGENAGERGKINAWDRQGQENRKKERKRERERERERERVSERESE